MKLLHIAYLHIGKRVNEFSMLEDQKYILKEILQHLRKGIKEAAPEAEGATRLCLSKNKISLKILKIKY